MIQPQEKYKAAHEEFPNFSDIALFFAQNDLGIKEDVTGENVYALRMMDCYDTTSIVIALRNIHPELVPSRYVEFMVMLCSETIKDYQDSLIVFNS